MVRKKSAQLRNTSLFGGRYKMIDVEMWAIKDVTTNKLVRNKWSRYLFVRKPAYWNMNLPGYYRNNGGMEKLEPIKVRVTEIVDD
jgi:hypothetical protein